MNKKVIILVLIVSLAITFLLGCKRSNSWLVSEPKYYTKEQLTELFGENQELFSEVADIVLSNEEIKEHIFDSNDGDFGICLTNDKHFFSNREWNKIVEFSGIVKYHMIMRDISFNADKIVSSDIVHFDFCPQKAGDSSENFVSLYYFSSQEIAETYIEDSVRPSEYSKVEPNWWIREQTYNWG